MDLGNFNDVIITFSRAFDKPNWVKKNFQNALSQIY
jgi:hypothetical protein